MRKPRKDNTPVGNRIRAKEVRLVTESGEQRGVVPLQEALQYAEEQDLDLVAVSPGAKPPVCRVMNYSKHKYEQEQKAKAARKKQKHHHTHEIKLRPRIADHDFETKSNHIRRFLEAGDKVKVSVMFRGREAAHADIGMALLHRVQQTVSDIPHSATKTKQEGRNMSVMLTPEAKKKS